MKTLRGQLTLRLMIVGALLLGAAGFALHWQVKRALGAEFDTGLHGLLQAVTTLTEQMPGGKIEIDVAHENAPQFQRERGGDVFILRAEDGREIQRSLSLGAAALPTVTGSPGLPEFADVRLPDGRVLRLAGVHFFPAIEDEERLSDTKVALVVGRDRTAMDRSLAMLRAALFIIGASALAVLAIAIAWGVNSGLAPVRRLRDEVCAVDAGKLRTRFDVAPLPAELQPVAASLNELLARLESAFDRERRFTGTAAHELRTPLAELRVLAEVNLKTPATAAEQAESWRDALATTQRMERLAVQLLALTRGEDTGGVAQRMPVDVASAVREAWKQHEARAQSRGIALEMSLPKDLSIQSDPTLLAVVLGNLCGNSAEHAPQGSRVRISVGAEPGAVLVLFRNRADGLTAADMQHLFERFWRKDAARSDAQHHGLGLALAQEFAVLLGGTLGARLWPAASDSKVQEIEFTLRLPCA